MLCCFVVLSMVLIQHVLISCAFPAAFLNMLCSLKFGIYIFFGAWQFIAIFFTYFLVPETRGVAIEEVHLFSC